MTIYTYQVFFIAPVAKYFEEEKNILGQILQQRAIDTISSHMLSNVAITTYFFCVNMLLG